MIKTERDTPTVFYKQSRDFQLIGRLYDVVLNGIKTKADLLYYLPLGINSNLNSIDLLATTLGFTPKNKYNAKQLEAVCSVLPIIIRNKGSLQAVITLINTILHAEGITDSLECSEQNSSIVIGIPDKLQDLNLINDLLDYILPAGISCELVSVLSLKIEAQTELETSDAIHVYGTNTNIDISNPLKENIATLPDLSSCVTKESIRYAEAKNKQGISVHRTVLAFDPITDTSTDTSTDQSSNSDKNT